MKLWTICILTINGREKYYDRLRSILDIQIENKSIEILTIKDNREKTIGEKRQIALDNSNSHYVSFIDDDDVIANCFCDAILQHLKKDVDGVGFRGIITSPHSYPMEFIHRNGLPYSDEPVKYFGSRVYLRPLNHLNPVRLEYAKEIGFNKSSFGEDKDFALRLVDSKLISDDIVVNDYLYYYEYRPKKEEL